MGKHLIIVFLILLAPVLSWRVLKWVLPKSLIKWIESEYSRIIILGLIVISVYLILYSFYAVDDWTYYTNRIDKKGQIGDKVGGIMNPMIAIAGVIVTGLAFWIQYQANIQVQKQFRIQQFESQVFKMIDLYRDNVSQWKFKSRISEDEYYNKDVAFIILKMFDDLITETNLFFFCQQRNSKKQLEYIVNSDYIDKLKVLNPHVDPLFWVKHELSYLVLFFGVSSSGIENIISHLGNNYKKENLRKFLNVLSYKSYRSKEEFEVISLSNDKDKLENPQYGSTKYYNGLQTIFAHHYRHIFNCVKYINEFEGITYQERWDYVKLLRTQFSNYEQILFHLNSISILGRSWELDPKMDQAKKMSKENYQLITKYDLIKNIPKGDRDNYLIESFYPKVWFEDLDSIPNGKDELGLNHYERY